MLICVFYFLVVFVIRSLLYSSYNNYINTSSIRQLKLSFQIKEEILFLQAYLLDIFGKERNSSLLKIYVNYMGFCDVKMDLNQ